jgi:hypothetical protein
MILANIASIRIKYCREVLETYIDTLVQCPILSGLGVLLSVLCSVAQPAATPEVVALIMKYLSSSYIGPGDEAVGFTSFCDLWDHSRQIRTDDTLAMVWAQITQNEDRYFSQIDPRFIKSFVPVLDLYRPLPIVLADRLLHFFVYVSGDREQDEAKARAAVARVIWNHASDWSELAGRFLLFGMEWLYEVTERGIEPRNIPYCVEIELVRVLNAYYEFDPGVFDIRNMIELQIRFLESPDLDHECAAKLLALLEMEPTCDIKNMLINAGDVIEKCMERGLEELNVTCESLLSLIAKWQS